MKTNEFPAKTVDTGKTRYILLHGVLGWGLLTASLFIIWTFFTKENMTTADIVIPFILFPISGIFWGASMWTRLKRRAPRDISDPSAMKSELEEKGDHRT